MAQWDKADIKAAIEKRGETLSSLAIRAEAQRKADMARQDEPKIHPMACRRAVHARNMPGERIISAFLDIPLWDLWPDRWRKLDETDGEPIRIDGRRRDNGEDGQ